MSHRLVQFTRYAQPLERTITVDERTITVLLRAEGVRQEAEDLWDECAVEDPPRFYRALGRIKADPTGELRPGRWVAITAAENDYIGFSDTEQLRVKNEPGEAYPKGLNPLL